MKRDQFAAGSLSKRLLLSCLCLYGTSEVKKGAGLHKGSDVASFAANLRRAANNGTTKHFTTTFALARVLSYREAIAAACNVCRREVRPLFYMSRKVLQALIDTE